MGTFRIAALLLACAAVSACGSGEVERPAPAPARPAVEPPPRGVQNLVLISLDTTRADALNAYGAERVTSPRIDRMAREGVLFEQAASSSPSTLPSHATLLTGHFPLRHGVRSNAGYRLPGEAVTLAEILRARGYRTGAEIAAPILDASRGYAQGFEQYRDLRAAGVERIQGRGDTGSGPGRAFDERPAADITKGGIRFVDAHRSERFFLWLHYFDPHLFYVERPAFKRQIPDDGYLAEVLYTDGQVGAFLDHLERLGLRERTLVVLVADHGEGRGEHDESTHAFFVYESTLRVPLVLWGPKRLPAGLRIEALVRTADVMPTALALLEVPAPSGLEGRSLLPLIEGTSQDLSLAAYGESVEFAVLFAGSPLRSLRRGSWKYIHQVEPELYDLAADPNELENLASRHPEKVASLQAELDALVRGTVPLGASHAPVSAAERAQLEQLGYVVGGTSDVFEARLASLEVRGRAPGEMAEDVELFADAQGALKMGKPEKAAANLETLLSRHPESASVHQEHAEALLALERPEEARTAYERAIRFSTCGARARLGLAAQLRSSGERAAQLDVLRQGVERCAPLPELLNNYAFVLATSPDESLRDGDEAVRRAEQALALFGESPEILDTLAAAQAETGDFVAAVATMRRAIQAARSQDRPAELTSLLERSLARFEAGEPLRDL